MTHQDKYEAYKEAVEAAGWKAYKDGLACEAELPFYVCRPTEVVKQQCVLNEKPPQLHAKLRHYYPGLWGNWNIPEQFRAELNMTGELPNGRWIRVEVDVDMDELLDADIVKNLDKMLSAAYDSAYVAAQEE